MTAAKDVKGREWATHFSREHPHASQQETIQAFIERFTKETLPEELPPSKAARVEPSTSDASFGSVETFTPVRGGRGGGSRGFAQQRGGRNPVRGGGRGNASFSRGGGSAGAGRGSAGAGRGRSTVDPMTPTNIRHPVTGEKLVKCAVDYMKNNRICFNCGKGRPECTGFAESCLSGQKKPFEDTKDE
ncbi:hypothetical protein DUNSADRAFT_4790 [Dunaliella salina]|uniref:Uncharacterized protein n=1 Tax=Dunaliella salina TaxID=3046 RepID=A0ABQ7GRD2_DUNSA|nr:hypothetical protein DUNSADRAFT_4790 [Dunaliella salina]|eukprot:KAF5837169.1 hypothetical protein DUNSADRAFT_4790 [Dunaliella salina]